MAAEAAATAVTLAMAAEIAAVVSTEVEVVAAGQIKATTAVGSAAAEPVIVVEANSVHTISTSEWSTVVVMPATVALKCGDDDDDVEDSIRTETRPLISGGVDNRGDDHGSDVDDWCADYCTSGSRNAGGD